MTGQGICTSTAKFKALPISWTLSAPKLPATLLRSISSVQGNRWVYRFQVVGADGRRRTVDVDAGAGVVMRRGEDD